jgi:hypothetical protein
VPTFGPKMVCTRCGIVGADPRPNWGEHHAQGAGLDAAQCGTSAGACPACQVRSARRHAIALVEGHGFALKVLAALRVAGPASTCRAAAGRRHDDRGYAARHHRCRPTGASEIGTRVLGRPGGSAFFRGLGAGRSERFRPGIWLTADSRCTISTCVYLTRLRLLRLQEPFHASYR